MYRATLQVHWLWARLELGVYSALAFALPVLALKTSGLADNTDNLSSFLEASRFIGVFMAVLAAIAGATLASRPWLKDDARNHVLALSLPVAWSHFVQLRFLSGATLLAIPAVAVWLGGLLAAVVIDVPSTLNVYPASIALRFLGASLVFYAVAFAIQYLGGRRGPFIAAGLLVVWLAAETIGQAFGLGSFTVGLWNVLTRWPGPFEVITARWMLVDV